MSLKLYVDEHVKLAISDGLRNRGVDLITVQDEHLEGTDDHILLARAISFGRVVFTQDEDFLAEAIFHQENGNYFTGVIYAHQDRLSIGQFIEQVELIAKVYELSEIENRVEYLPIK